MAVPEHIAVAIKKVVTVFDELKIGYLIYGSTAACLHGATLIPNDVDIYLDSFLKKDQIIEKLKAIEGATANVKLIFMNAKVDGIDFQIINNAKGESGHLEKHTVQMTIANEPDIAVFTLTLATTCRKLITRDELRDVDIESFIYLIQTRGATILKEDALKLADFAAGREELTPKQHTDIIKFLNVGASPSVSQGE